MGKNIEQTGKGTQEQYKWKLQSNWPTGANSKRNSKQPTFEKHGKPRKSRRIGKTNKPSNNKVKQNWFTTSTAYQNIYKNY